MSKLPLPRLIVLFVLLLAGVAPAVRADPAADELKKHEQVAKLIDGLKPQDGTIHLRDNIASIALTHDFQYLSPEDTETVLHDLWGNPPNQQTLGMIVPRGFRARGWAVMITYSDDGFVKDEDAATTDYGKILQQMKDAAPDINKERVKEGYPTVDIIGWAVPPHYDAASHKLYWARELKFGGRESRPNTLNYDVRILGRHGYLVLNAIASMPQLKQIEDASPKVVAMVNFNDGNRYADFAPSTDKVATYGVAALVLGGLAAKAGFFKLLLVGILAAKKLILVGAAAVWAFFKKMFKRKDRMSDLTPKEPTPPAPWTPPSPPSA